MRPGLDATPFPDDDDVALDIVEVGRFSEPVHVTSAPGRPDEIYVVERAGRIMRIGADGKPSVFFDISDRVALDGPEQGLFSVAFPPNHARSGLFYVHYSNTDGDIAIDESSRDEPASRRNVLTVKHPASSGTSEKEDVRVHYGGQLAFGPDGLLYIGVGDGGGQKDPRGRGQDRSSRLGKILRLDPRRAGNAAYRVPNDNPFVGEPDAAEEIYAYGLRNPWRFSFDRTTGDMYIGDVGQYGAEEVNWIDGDTGGGHNFGWSCFEGTQRSKDCSAPGHIEPVLVRPSSSSGRCASIVGGFVVHDPGLPSLRGRYLYTDLCVGRLRSAAAGGGRLTDDRDEGLTIPWASTFGEDERGRIYVASIYGGGVYRLVAAQ